MNNLDVMMQKNERLLCYYGDDFTGSTDVMEALAMNGVETVLFLEPPSAELLAQRFPNVECFGVAGVSRTMTPDEMERELRPTLELLKSYGTAVVHYKICSTFDSSPRAGSIGKVLEMGREIYSQCRYVPIVAGVPILKRYTVFGHHFAAAGADGETYRLDRHPTMSRHPITPIHESDLRLLLRQQTELPVALMELPALDGEAEKVAARLEQRLENKETAAVLFDVLDVSRLETTGRLIWQEALDQKMSLFVIGSSGVEYALTAHWASEGLVDRDNVQLQAPGEVDQLLVVSGSCSPVTQSQIEWALGQGYAAIQVPVQDWLEPNRAEESRQALLKRVIPLLVEGRNVILYSAIGPEDPAIEALRKVLDVLGLEPADSGRIIGMQLGRLTRDILQTSGLRRILIAGGDTSGYVTRELGIYAMSCISTIVPGGPLCRCYAEDSRMDGLQLSLKGGQVGGADYFERVRRGGLS
ncbi:four-carbon acid sugar kinase family protein [Paenibacillus sp. LHD-38]|uniref:four-carbon acid sugar kinase family protein n=1 Tax=Paenibacillus sp. LHD-38 TaxID=3072143 RepID=UPI00280FDC7D|nr:four-carbon acid sugar kinase family protein [Paenibacillus sp. LHD-38]MDQ8735361.1 four-carbon acid sugar kinase family protein [Paenibacillus sp. LHD-38]